MTPYYADEHLTLYGGDCRVVLAELEPESVHCVVTSPPYWGLRDYGVDGQLGLEATPEAYVEAMVAVFREVRRALRSDGTVWLNLGDSYSSGTRNGQAEPSAHGIVGHPGMRNGRGRRPPVVSGLKPKDRVLMPARVALGLQADGWWLRDEIVWHKPNAMPSSVRDRTTLAHEMVYMLSKSSRYHYDAEAVREVASEDAGTAPVGRNLRSVWNIATEPYPGAHFATFPRKLVEPCVKAGCPGGGTVLDPFAGSGTTLLVAQALGRRGVGIDLNPDYLRQALDRNRQSPLGLVG